MDLLSEGEQWEELKAGLRKYGASIIGGLLVGVLIWVGWRWYQGHREQQQVDAAARYDRLLDAYSRGDLTGGNAQLEELKREHGKSIYVVAGQLAAAKVYVTRNELDNAAAALSAVVDGSEPRFSMVARMRLARVQLDQAKYDEALKTLDVADPGAYEGQYDEIRGDILLRKGDPAGALREYRQAREKILANAGGAAQDLTALLDLKIHDLETEPGAAPPAQAPAAAPPAAAAPAPAKPTPEVPAAPAEGKK